MLKPRIFWLLGALLVGLTACSSHGAQSSLPATAQSQSTSAKSAAKAYTIVGLGNPARGLQGFTAYPTALNNVGQMAALEGPGNMGITIPYLWTGDHWLSLLPTQLEGTTEFVSINASGMVVGSNFNRDQGGGQAKYCAATASAGCGSLPVLNAQQNQCSPSAAAHAINGAGTIVGYSNNNSNQQCSGYSVYAVVWTSDHRTVTRLYNDPSVANAINDAGTIVGVTGGGSNDKAVIFANDGTGAVTMLLPGVQESAAVAINQHGHILITSSAGTYLYVDSQTLYDVPITNVVGLNNNDDIIGNVCGNTCVALLYHNNSGKVVALSTLLPANSGWKDLFAAAINDRGQIAGSGKLNGNAQSFLMTPN